MRRSDLDVADPEVLGMVCPPTPTDSPERALLRAMILQALRDAGARNDGDREAALQWLFGDAGGAVPFRAACEHLGLDAGWIQRMMQRSFRTPRVRASVRPAQPSPARRKRRASMRHSSGAA